ncbi:MAG: biopolymer transporter ExbD [Odoribacter sp.]|nr:biopolymer transporter ExbD [Odoribacter sp.]
MAKRTPEINATSTADIAFLLLVFFLVTTTMNVDSGMYRRLPPYQPEETEPPKIPKRNLLSILVSSDSRVLLEGEEIAVPLIKDRVLEFILNPNNDENLPEKSVKNIELIGNVEVSKGIVSLQNHIGTPYETYIAVQDQLTAAYNEARDQKAMTRFGEKYLNLSTEEQNAIRAWIPTSISEAEPANVKTR